MKKRRGKNAKPEEIIRKLREIDIHLKTGLTVKEAARKIGVTDATYYKWRNKFGNMQIDEAKRLKALEKENARLKRLVADLSLDNAMLKEVASGNF